MLHRIVYAAFSCIVLKYAGIIAVKLIHYKELIIVSVMFFSDGNNWQCYSEVLWKYI